ncbi:thioesterase family protein [Bradyrhizobium sp. Ai1a-2]|uniref:thioesterase family protein n=1 Tax=Bradyrhizobium sp. Ai1a-2 TaxID=196490 RepID=UPI00041C776E|nr:thioesterase family protein [Bradyrhizobium sp. Ai1a-2]
MDARELLKLDMSAETTIVVRPEMTVGHFVPGMPRVYATPMMILHMEIAAGAAISAALPKGFVSVGMEVNVRHLAATPVGHTVRATARVVELDSKHILFAVEAWNEERKIGEGTHRRGIVNVAEFEKRFGVNENAAA